MAFNLCEVCQKIGRILENLAFRNKLRRGIDLGSPEKKGA